MNLGVAAHITAASLRGPRFSGSMTREGRRHPSNGIWLCQNCAKLVDNDAEQFPEDTLRVWKLRAETEALAAIGKSAGRATRTAYIDLQRLLVNSQTRGVALAKVVAEVLVAAKEAKIDDLASFCEQEILGWRDEKHATPPPYRFAGVFISLNEINLKYYGWGATRRTFSRRLGRIRASSLLSGSCSRSRLLNWKRCQRTATPRPCFSFEAQSAS
jgi:hypothetical protein